MTLLSYHSLSLSLIALETMRLLVQDCLMGIPGLFYMPLLDLSLSHILPEISQTVETTEIANCSLLKFSFWKSMILF